MTVKEWKLQLRNLADREYFHEQEVRKTIFGSEEPFDTQACTPEDRQILLSHIQCAQRALNRKKKMLSKLTQALIR